MNKIKEYSTKQNQDLVLTKKSDDIALEDIGEYRALLSCGHACDPNSLTQWCRMQIDDGKFEFTCPALTNNNKQCNRVWSYDEVRRLAMLDENEQEYFETRLNENCIKLINLSKCPECSSHYEMNDCARSGLRVDCTICPLLFKKSVAFCWQCEKHWIETANNSRRDKCARDDCRNKDLDILAKCKKISLSGSPGLPEFPSIRACPKCGKLVEHNGTGCKNVLCPKCKVEFCFVCLETTQMCQMTSHGHSSRCAKPVEPVQTSLPHLSNLSQL